MKTVSEIKQEMELVEIVKSALDVNGQVARKLIKEWTSDEAKEFKVSIDPNKYKWDKAILVKGEYILNKADADKFLNSSNKVADILNKHWSNCIAKVESENPVELKKDFNIKSIPLQLLTKVNKDTSSKEIEHILNTIKSIEPSGIIKFSKEYTELTRLEGILENRIEENLKVNEYKTLEINVRLLKKIKENYKPFKPIGCTI
ncbi:hypothetical protein QH639_18325 [Lysinibacillus sp. 1 U-2021]|uniref:hypothetical protein n=1 Tax=Lysinibacillus sp. 1 U-2021 TaxID=3039426 RepID=UPI002480D8C8|nr:hypothetical protein [Lysinibacillus sp. 1 U-2021]WGT37777.1 hypothetical protein QH639_18325 [Lysinibacillus sp. 1 U-2021]